MILNNIVDDTKNEENLSLAPRMDSHIKKQTLTPETFFQFGECLGFLCVFPQAQSHFNDSEIV